MEKWKLAAIAAIIFSFVGYGVFANSSANRGVAPVPGTGTGFVLPPAAPPAPQVGQTLPAWPTIKQWANAPAPVSLAQLKGQPVLLEVFRTQCSHCQDAAPFLAKLHARYAPRGLKFVAIQSPGAFKDPANPENNWTQVQAWAKARGYSWPVGFDVKSAWFQGNFKSQVLYPSLYLIDKNGKIAWFQSGHDAGKAVLLALELERATPGSGEASARASDLQKWLADNGALPPGADVQDQIVERLNT